MTADSDNTKDHTQGAAQWKWLFHRLRPFWKLQLYGITSLVIGTTLSLVDPLLMKWLIDSVLPRKDLAYLGAAVACSFAIYVGRVFLQNVASMFTLRVGQSLALKLRIEIFAHLERMTARFYKTHAVGDLVQRLERDVDVICDQGADLLPALLRTVLVLVLVLATMFALSWRLALPLLPLLPVFLIVRYRYRGRLQQAADAVREVAGRQSEFLTESLSAMVQVQLLGCERQIARRYAGALAKTTRATSRRRVMELEFGLFSMLVVAVGAMTILGYGGYEVILGFLTIGGLVAFYGYVLRLFEPLSTTVELFARVHRIEASLCRLVALREEMPDVQDAPGATPIARSTKYRLGLQDVSFSYEQRVAGINKVSTRMQSGEIVFVVGSSGSGKSTMARLLCRLYDVTEGVIEVNGSDIRTHTVESLRRCISTVPQEPVLFSASLRENLLIAKPTASERDLVMAAEVASLIELIHRLPHGWDEQLGTLGSRLSGGERQRVALARALLQQRPILILDEATSALDAESETHVLSRVRDHVRNCLLIIISHRLANAHLADRVFVMEEGQIVEEGNHASLLELDGRYADLWRHGRSASSDTARTVLTQTIGFRSRSAD
jgi:ABC-type bacteriocin/lantibiotic exporter with double-glycine peptidase domain